MLTFTSVTTIEFKSMEDLEAMIKQMPLQPHEINQILDGDEFTDTQDQAEAVGAGKTVHKFKVTGKEE